MDVGIGLILKVAGIGLLVTVTCQMLSKMGREEQSVYVSVAGMIIVFMMLLFEIENLIEAVRGIFNI